MRRYVAGCALAVLACAEAPSTVGAAPPQVIDPESSADSGATPDGGGTYVDDLWPPVPAGQTSCHLRLHSGEVCHVPGWVRAPGIGPGITSLAAFAEDEIWGVDAIGALLRWDGTAFSGGLRDDGRAYLWAWGSSRDDIWIVGERGLVSHWDGVALTDLDVPTTRDVTRVHGSAADDVWLVAGGLALQWNGRHFDERPLPVRNRRILDVVAFAPHDAWAVSTETVATTNPGPNVHRWTGLEWTPVAGEVEGEVCSNTQPGCYTQTFPVAGARIAGGSSRALWVGSDWQGGFFRTGETWTQPFAGRHRIGLLLASAVQGDEVVLVTEYGESAGGSMTRYMLRVGPTGASVHPAPRVTALASLGGGRLVAGMGARLGWFENGTWSIVPEIDMGWARPPRAFSPYENPYDGTHEVALVRHMGTWTPAWIGPEGVDIYSDGDAGAWVDAAPTLLHVTSSGIRTGPVPPQCDYRSMRPLPGGRLFLLCGFFTAASQGYVLETTGWIREELPFERGDVLRSNARGSVLVHARDGSMHLRRNGWTQVPTPPSRVGTINLADDDGVVFIDTDFKRAWLRNGAQWRWLDLPDQSNDVTGPALDDLVFGSRTPWHWDGRTFQRGRFDRLEYVVDEWVGIDRGALLQRRGP